MTSDKENSNYFDYQTCKTNSTYAFIVLVSINKPKIYVHTLYWIRYDLYISHDTPEFDYAFMHTY